MKRRLASVATGIGVLALVMAGLTADLQAQSGAGSGPGKPATPGQAGPATPVKPTPPEKPTPPAKPDHPDRDAHAVKPKPASATNKVGDQLERNADLSARLQTLLPAGTNLQTASGGFQTLGQFVAAAHVSQNLGIPFDQLKAKMTGDHPVSLGRAIQELRPSADAKAEVKKAEQQARDDMKPSDKRPS